METRPPIPPVDSDSPAHGAAPHGQLAHSGGAPEPPYRPAGRGLARARRERSFGQHLVALVLFVPAIAGGIAWRLITRALGLFDSGDGGHGHAHGRATGSAHEPTGMAEHDHAPTPNRSGKRRIALGAAGAGALTLMLLALWLTAPELRSLRTNRPVEADASQVLEADVISVRVVRAASSSAERPLSDMVPETVVRIRVAQGPMRGREVDVSLGGGGVPSLTTAARPYRSGDRVLVAHEVASQRSAGAGEAPDTERPVIGEEFRLLDHVRWPWMIWGVVLFTVAVVAVARGQGARALVGLASAVAVLWWFVIPRLLAGQPPIPVALTGCALIAVPALLLTSGWGRDSWVPLAGIGCSLAVVGVLTVVAVNVSHLTGLAASEELSLVYVSTRGAVNPQGLLLAGMLIGAVGGLVDVTIGQAVAVFEFHAGDPAATRANLFRRGMNVGRAHVSAAVHTLVLAYAGAALPLLLLIGMYAPDLPDLWNREMIASELLQSVAGGVGLSIAMPLTTWFACLTCRPAPAQRRPPPAHLETA